MQGMKQALDGMSADDMKRMREMLRDINRMLRQRAEGDEPDFDAFKQKWGQILPGRREPRPAARPDRAADGAHAVADGEHVARPAPPAPGDDVEPVPEGRTARGRVAQFAMHLDELGLTRSCAVVTTSAATTS